MPTRRSGSHTIGKPLMLSAAPETPWTDSAGNFGVAPLDLSGLSALGSRVGNLEGQVGTLFDLAAVERRETNRGVAAAVALTAALFPSAPGKTSYTANTAVYRGELAIGASLAHRPPSEPTRRTARRALGPQGSSPIPHRHQSVSWCQAVRWLA